MSTTTLSSIVGANYSTSPNSFGIIDVSSANSIEAKTAGDTLFHHITSLYKA